MKLSIAKQALNEAIQQANKAVASKTSIPILSGIKLDVNEEGLTLTASDTEISIQTFIPTEQNEHVNIELEQSGSVVLPAKLFVELVKKLPSQWIELEVGNHFVTSIRSGTSDIQLVGLDPEEFPTLPHLSEERIISVESQLLEVMIRQTSYAASTNETTPILTGILWSIHNDVLKFIATDRHRLASREAAVQGSEKSFFQPIVVPSKTLNELSKLLPEQSTIIDVVIADNQVMFRIDQLLFYSRILDGIYPDTSKIIPQTFKTELNVNTKLLIDALDRAYLMSREDKSNIVRLTSISEELIEISSSSSELGRVNERIDIRNFQGEPLKIAFNSKYMLEVLKVIEAEQISIGFNGAMSPIIIKPLNSNEILNLILPYRTTN